MQYKKQQSKMAMGSYIAALIVVAANIGEAAVLANYSFTGYATTSATSPPDYQSPGVDASDFARSAVLRHDMNLGGFTTTGWPADANSLKPLHTSYYIGFTIAPEVGMT
ncbi:MAG TPA: hypothetical protein VLO11_08860, partial [Luteolibacter sp.]|nr:hypothetical protein [Luteolibacter sp.]